MTFHTHHPHNDCHTRIMVDHAVVGMMAVVGHNGVAVTVMVDAFFFGVCLAVNGLVMRKRKRR